MGINNYYYYYYINTRFKKNFQSLNQTEIIQTSLVSEIVAVLHSQLPAFVFKWRQTVFACFYISTSSPSLRPPILSHQ